MAAVSECPNCGAEVGAAPSGVCPECFMDLRAVPTTSSSAAVGDRPADGPTGGSPGADTPGGGPAQVGTRRCATEGCGGVAAPASELCPTCQLMASPTGSAYVLTGSWGRFRLAAGDSLTIGRSPESAPRTAAMLANADRVSRLHADISNDGGSLRLTDHSANGTVVNGVRLECGVPQTLLAGDRLVLGTQVEFVVHVDD